MIINRCNCSLINNNSKYLLLINELVLLAKECAKDYMDILIVNFILYTKSFIRN